MIINIPININTNTLYEYLNKTSQFTNAYIKQCLSIDSWDCWPATALIFTFQKNINAEHK